MNRADFAETLKSQYEKLFKELIIFLKIHVSNLVYLKYWHLGQINKKNAFPRSEKLLNKNL